MTTLNQAKIALASHDARGVVEKMAGDPFEDVAVAAMRAARGNFMAPTDEEAFVGAVGALIEGFPDLPILAEATALGDRTKVMAALLSGVPVDTDAALEGLAPFPDPPLNLVRLFDRSRQEGI